MNMMTQSNVSKDFMHGVPELLVLRLLADQEMYGYEIVRGIREQSGGEVSFGEGLIYPLLHGLHKRRLVAIRKSTYNGRQRIYYRLTASGRKKLEQKVSNWERITSVVQQILDGGGHEASAR